MGGVLGRHPPTLALWRCSRASPLQRTLKWFTRRPPTPPQRLLHSDGRTQGGTSSSSNGRKKTRQWYISDLPAASASSNIISY